ncbi:MAG: general secretion pathway protein GspB [Nitrospirota bacterium]
MSYILDALKKSEKERQRGAVPDVLTVQEPGSYDRRKRSAWPYLIIAALLLNAGILIWWAGFLPGKKGNAAKVDSVVSMVPRETAPTSTAAVLPALGTNPTDRTESEKHPENGGREAVVKADNAEPSVKPKQGVVRESSQKTQAKVNEERTSKETSIQHDKIQTGDDSHKLQAAVPKPDPNKTYNVAELPEAIRKSLPPLSLTIAFYSDDPASRVARIDGQTVREGEYLASGLLLESITPQEVIFSFKGYRFRIRMK